MGERFYLLLGAEIIKQAKEENMPRKTLRNLHEGALKNSVVVQRYRISKEDVQKVKEAEKVGHNEAVRVLLDILFNPRRTT
jgi:hypothetical protein